MTDTDSVSPVPAGRSPAPDNLYPTPRPLSPDQIDAVIAYLQARIIGRGRITKEECLAYYAARPDECDDIK